MKFEKSLCQNCNNARSQPFDNAYDIFAGYLAQQEQLIVSRGWLRFSDLFGSAWPASRDDVVRYYVKHVGCRLADGGAKVPQPFIDFLDRQTSAPLSLDLTIGIRLDILEMARHIEQAHGVLAAAGVWLGDLVGTYSASRREVTALWSHMGVGAIRAEYTVWFDGKAYESTYRLTPHPCRKTSTFRQLKLSACASASAIRSEHAACSPPPQL